MTEDISQVLKKRTMVTASLGMDTLQMVLNTICDVLKRHDNSINEFSQIIVKKVDQTDFDNEVKRNDQRIQEISNLLESTKGQLNEEIFSLREKLQFLEKKAEENNKTLTEKIDNSINGINEQVQTQHMIHNTAFSKLNNSLEDCRSNIGNINNDLHEVKDMLKSAGLSSVNAMIDRIDACEGKFSSLTTALSNVHNNIDQTAQAITEKMNAGLNNLGQEVHRISKQLDEIQTQYMVDPKYSQEPTLENSTNGDVTPLVLAVHRDSRRLDGVDKQISAVRIECENVASAMENAQNILQKFNHTIYDFQCQLDGTRNEILDRFQMIEPFVQWVGLNVRDLWSFIQQVGANSSHIASNASRGQDDLYNLVNSISSRPLPPVHSLDEVLIESSTIQDQLHEKRMNVDFEKQYSNIRPIFRKKWKTQINLEKPKDIPSFDKSINTLNTPGLMAIQGIGNGGGGGREDPMIMITLEEMRVKFNKFEQKLPSFINEVEEIIKGITAKVETKMSVTETDRLFVKTQKKLRDLESEVSSLKDGLAMTSRTIQSVAIENSTAREEAHQPEVITTVRINTGRKHDLSQYPNLNIPISRPLTAQSTKVRTSKPKHPNTGKLASESFTFSITKI